MKVSRKLAHHLALKASLDIVVFVSLEEGIDYCPDEIFPIIFFFFFDFIISKITMTNGF